MTAYNCRFSYFRLWFYYILNENFIKENIGKNAQPGNMFGIRFLSLNQVFDRQLVTLWIYQ